MVGLSTPIDSLIQKFARDEDGTKNHRNTKRDYFLLFVSVSVQEVLATGHTECSNAIRKKKHRISLLFTLTHTLGCMVSYFKDEEIPSEHVKWNGRR